MTMAYTPAATAHAVAVLLSTEEAEGITGPVSTVDHVKTHPTRRLNTRYPTYLKISLIRYVDAFPGRLDEHAPSPQPRAKRLGKVHASDSRAHANETNM